MKNLFFYFMMSMLAATSIVLFCQHSYIIAYLTLVLAMVGINGFIDLRTEPRFATSEVERKSNVVIDMNIDISAVLKHPSIERLYTALEKEKAEGINFDGWVSTLIENYKKKYEKETPFHNVKFQIKSGIIWKNDEVDHLGIIYDSLFIPYSYNPEDEEDVILWEDTTEGIEIRVLSVNGQIRLQVGKFTKEMTPEFYREGGLSVYRKYELITTFPLMYLGWCYGLPTRSLMESFQATQWYKDMRFSEKKPKEYSSDWQEFKKDLKKYNFLLENGDSDTVSWKRYGQEARYLKEKARAEIEREKFTDHDADVREDSWRWEDGSRTYSNSYLTILLSDLNIRIEKMQEYVLPDYWEETA